MKKRHVQAMMAGLAAMLSITLPATTVWAAVPEKEQTVYVNADENGNTEKVIVSNWLKNVDKESALTDKSDLKNIQNVKGNETFTQSSDGTVTWKADGNDIYYQGESDQEIPVSVKMTYFLDGKEIPASELAGKSGRVKIRIDYENKSRQEVIVNGKKETIFTPFMMVTGMILPTEKFTNIEVKNGKVISDGKNDIVVGMGFPGLSESLRLSELKEKDSRVNKKEIPDYVEITADVDDFSLALTATVATTGTLKDLGLDEIDSMDELEEKLGTLTSSSEALVKGSQELKDGVEKLNSSADVFVEGLSGADNGAGQIREGIISYTNGAKELSSGIRQTEEGAAGLKAGLDTLNAKKDELTAGMTKLAGGTKELKAGTAEFRKQLGTYTEKISELSAGVAEMQNQAGAFSQMQSADAGNLSMEATRQAQNAAAAKLQAANAEQAVNVKAALEAAGLTEEQKAAVLANLAAISTEVQDVQVSITPDMMKYSAGFMQGIQKALGEADYALNELNGYGQQLNAGAAGIVSGAEEVADGIGAVSEGAGAMGDGVSALAAGAGTLYTGTSQLKDGAETLISNNDMLLGGARTLKEGTGKLAMGGKELKTGTKKLSVGASELAGGMSKFHEEGIQKLTDILEGELKSVIDRMKAAADADGQYRAFDGASGNGTGSVKFIIETAGIE